MVDFLVELVTELLGGLIPERPAERLLGVLMLLCGLALASLGLYLAYAIAFQGAGERTPWFLPLLFFALSWLAFSLARRGLGGTKRGQGRQK